MKKTTFKAKIAVLSTAFLFISSMARSQMDTAFHLPAVFYDELHRITDAYGDSTNADTLVLTQLGLTAPGYFTGYEILNSDDVIDLISTCDFVNDNGDNNIIFPQTSKFTFDNENFEKTYTYAVERKTFNKVKINGVNTSNRFCLHIRENIYITKIPVPDMPIEVQNNYYVVFDNGNVQHISAYHEAVMANALTNGKYYDASPGSKSTLSNYFNTAGLTEYFTVFPNPAYITVNLQVMLNTTADAKIIITDVLGRKVKDINAGSLQKQTKYSFSQNIADLTAGVYNVTIITNSENKSVKLVISK